MKNFLEKLDNLLKRLVNEKYTGEIILRIFLNDGGIRSTKLIEEKQKNF